MMLILFEVIQQNVLFVIEIHLTFTLFSIFRMPGHISSLIRTYVVIISFQNRNGTTQVVKLVSHTVTVMWQIIGKAQDAELYLTDGYLIPAS